MINHLPDHYSKHSLAINKKLCILYNLLNLKLKNNNTQDKLISALLRFI